MFTGLVQSLGKIKLLDQDHLQITLEDTQSLLMSDLALGDSIAVDGICLTVETILSNGFIVTVSPETIKRSTIGCEQAATISNLEASLRMGSKLGGHFVTGHIDGIGSLAEVKVSNSAWEMSFTYPEIHKETWTEAIAPYLVLKGSIAVNGISLTIARCDSESFTVAVIPHTYEHTNLSYLQLGNWVNLESDILGKYVNRLLTQRFALEKTIEEIDLSFLTEHGY